jgi:uncharacterized protein with FMN-binding domain
MFPKRGAIALVTTALALVLLLSFKTPAGTTPGAIVASGGGSTTASAPTSSATTTVGSAATSAPTATTGSAATSSPTTASTTVTGSLVSTRYGDVEVQVTIASGKITQVVAVTLPSGGRSGQISSSAAPRLASEALSAQSATIDVVSGATYTSEAYAQSLQAALDQAGIGMTQANG